MKKISKVIWGVLTQTLNIEFGKFVRELRISKDLTQEKLAELSDCNPRYIQKLEYGKASPSLNFLIKLAKAFELKPSELLFRFEKI